MCVIDIFLSFTLPQQLHCDRCELWLQTDMLQFWYESALMGGQMKMSVY